MGRLDELQAAVLVKGNMPRGTSASSIMLWCEAPEQHRLPPQRDTRLAMLEDLTLTWSVCSSSSSHVIWTGNWPCSRSVHRFLVNRSAARAMTLFVASKIGYVLR